VFLVRYELGFYIPEDDILYTAVGSENRNVSMGTKERTNNGRYVCSVVRAGMLYADSIIIPCGGGLE
jgi:hypothetical protein